MSDLVGSSRSGNDDDLKLITLHCWSIFHFSGWSDNNSSKPNVIYGLNFKRNKTKQTRLGERLQNQVILDLHCFIDLIFKDEYVK